MSAIYVLIPVSLFLATAFLVAFVWAVRSGQYEDTCTPSMRMLSDDPAGRAPGHSISVEQPKTNHDERRNIQIR
jgi:cbb3-type cytochrome oxidase maturation protein